MNNRSPDLNSNAADPQSAPAAKTYKMPSIITITFNPALDKSLSIPNLVPDKKLRCSTAVYEPGGGGINVARAIKHLGGKAAAVYLSGGDAGRKITRMLTDDDIESIPIEIAECTRENLVVADIIGKKQYLFDMPGPEVTTHEWKKCLDVVTSLQGIEYMVVSGSLPPGVPDDVYEELSLVAKQKNARLIVDTAGEGLKRAVQAGVYLIKPNARELAKLVGKEELDSSSITSAAQQLIGNGKCEAVVVSMGRAGAILVTKAIVLEINAPDTEQAKSTVGAGDSMVAGIVMGLTAGKTLPEAVQFGVACGTAATLHAGTELCKREDVEKLYNLIKDQACCAI